MVLNSGGKNTNNNNKNLAKLDDGLDKSPTVMVVDKTKNKTIFGKNRGILKPS